MVHLQVIVSRSFLPQMEPFHVRIGTALITAKSARMVRVRFTNRVGLPHRHCRSIALQHRWVRLREERPHLLLVLRYALQQALE